MVSALALGSLDNQMAASFLLTEPLSVGDLVTYLGRAGRVEEGSVRLVATPGVLAVYSAILYPAGLLDGTPTVLGLKTFELEKIGSTGGEVEEPDHFDVVVPVRSLLDRLNRISATDAADHGPVRVGLPMEVSTVTWAGISPPRGGWQRVNQTTAGILDDEARRGIEEVASAVPQNTGEQLVHRVRSEVWGKPIESQEHVPAGAAFAALSLGFLSDDRAESIAIFETGPWTRLTSKRGHVLVRRKAWSLLG